MKFTERNVEGRRVRISEGKDKPLLILVRMAAHDLGLWDNIWPELSNDFTVASFDLSVPDYKSKEPRAILHDMAQECVDVASALGHERFHYFGWHGGAQVGIRMAIDFPERLLSSTLMGAIYEPDERGPTEHLLRIIEATLAPRDLEFYTYFWFLSGITPEFAQDQYDKIKAMVDRRVELDSTGRLDADNIVAWARMQRQSVVNDEELARIITPMLLLSPAYALWPPLHTVRRMVAKIKTAQLGIPRCADLGIWEDPDAIMAVAGRFLRSAKRGTPPASILRNGDEVTIFDRGLRTGVVEPARRDEAIVFLHGWLMSPQIFDAPMEALRGRMRILAPWQPAHGGSTAPPIDWTIEDWADWLAATMDRNGVRRAVLVGHSMGGMLAMAFRKKYPDRVSALALVSTRAGEWPIDDRRDFIQLADAVGAAWSPELARQCADLLLGEEFLESRAGWLGAWHYDVARYDLPGMSNLARAFSSHPGYGNDLAASRLPALVVHGADDEAIEVEIARAMAASIPGAEYAEIADCGHCPPLEHPTAFTNALVRFLERHALIEGREAVGAR
jgi:pimeloyl-ACP methyl ester carboxylesterase